jgi:hypothetical protein
MRWLLYLLLYIPVQLFAYLITPLLPLFATSRMGAIDNANGQANEPRLPNWLSWFMTPDNSLYGDNNWKANNYYTKHWSMVAWLYRNSLYGFKWNVLAIPIQKERTVTGNLLINHHTKTYGSFYIKQANGAWQYKLVKPIASKILILNIGWLLDDVNQKRALFMFSPRLK